MVVLDSQFDHPPCLLPGQEEGSKKAHGRAKFPYALGGKASLLRTFQVRDLLLNSLLGRGGTRCGGLVDSEEGGNGDRGGFDFDDDRFLDAFDAVGDALGVAAGVTGAELIVVFADNHGDAA